MSIFAPFPFGFGTPEGRRVHLESFRDFADVVEEHSRQHGVAWRGQVDAAWRLTSSAFVAEQRRIELYAEANQLGDHAKHILTISQNVEERTKDASRGLQRALSTDPHLRLLLRDELSDRDIHNKPSQYAELLSIGQHFGMKTPLLDMTDSPYVALHFAAYDAMARGQEWRRSHRLAVWKVPTHLWNPHPNRMRREYVMVRETSPEELARRQAELRQIPVESLSDDAVRIAVENVFPRIYQNDRLVAQRGSFVRVTPDLPLDHVVAMLGTFDDDGPFEPMAQHLIQYTLPARPALDYLTHLDKMNIRPSTLFPDMVGQMSSINLAMDHYDYSGQTDRYRAGTAFNVHGERREDFYP